MRAFGLRVPPPLARFVRFRLREILTWPMESFLLLGKHLYVRSWLLESPGTLERLSSGSLSLDDLSDLKVWRPWWMVVPTLRRGVSVLTCEPYGRWGNRVVQAALGLAAAEVFHAESLLLRSDDFGRDVSQRLDNGLSLVGVNPHGARVHDRTGVAQSSVVIEANWLLSQSAFRDRRHVIEGFRALREAELEISHSVATSNYDLVIHFRGTDQLTQDWRPPPLSFFIKSALHSQAASVLVVSDDPDNPLVRDLLDRLKGHGLTASMQSRTLEDDIATILNAPRVCIGVGTFASSVVALSRSVHTVYSWKQPDWSTWTHLVGTFDVRPDVKHYWVYDASETYILPFSEEEAFPPSAVARHVSDFPEDHLRITDAY